MEFVQPKVYRLAQTKLDNDGVLAWLTDLGGENCLAHISGDDKEQLIELAGRRCYKSFDVGLNPNITRIRTDSKIYHDHVQESRHGSIDEHASVTFAFENVSRIFCYSDDTDVLTDEGWKNWKDVTGKEKFASLKDNELIYEPCEEYFCKEYIGKMYSVQNSQIDLMVTPNHRMWIRLQQTQKRRRNEEKFGIKLAKDIFHKEVSYQKGDVVWHGDLSDFFVIPDVKERGARNRIVKGKSIRLDIFAKFLGYFLSEGTISKADTSIHLYQNNNDVLDDMKLVVEAMGMKYSVHKNGDNSFNLQFKFLPLYYWLEKECGRISFKKEIPNIVRTWASKYIKLFIDAMISGDGNVHKKNWHEVLYTTSKKIADATQELSLKIGISANIRLDNRIGLSRKLKTGQIFTNKRICYIVSFVRSKNQYPLVNSRLKTAKIYKKQNGYHDEYIDYEGNVYCVKVPSGLLYVRRNGKPCWSGNTHELVRHRTGTAMSQESLRYVRLDKLNFWIPSIFSGDDEKSKQTVDLIKETLIHAENVQKQLAEIWDISNIKDFGTKKELTSAFRRLAPDGIATGIVFTFNMRALRFIIEKRTAADAEEEIRLVFGQVAEIMMKDCPYVFGDFTKVMKKGLCEYVPRYSKI